MYGTLKSSEFWNEFWTFMSFVSDHENLHETSRKSSSINNKQFAGVMGFYETFCKV